MNSIGRKYLWFTIAALGVILVFMMRHLQRLESGVVPDYVGIRACAKCHGSEALGNQYKIWASSPHAKTCQILSTAQGIKIGKKNGTSKPEEDMRCLKCHTTGGGAVAATRAEGVGCEACHGPGSKYFEFSNHASFDNRESSYKKATRLGMYPILGIEGIKSREKLCRSCHTDERPCVPTSAGERKRQVLSLSIIANFPFKHPIRR